MIKPRDELDSIKLYTPGKSKEQAAKEGGGSSFIKLSSNESPLGSPISAEALKEAIDSACEYPDQSSARLKSKLAELNGCEYGQIILGNGSDDVIQMLGLAYLNKGDEMLTGEYSFSVYQHVTTLMGGVTRVAKMPEYSYDVDAILEQVTKKTKIIFIANPNNPTGTSLSPGEVERLLRSLRNDILCVMDEAYIDFSQYKSSLDKLTQFPNLIILRTFSKAFGLAGFRVGFGVAHSRIIENLEKVRQPFNVNSLALLAAELVLDKPEYVQKNIKNAVDQKALLVSVLAQLPVRVLPSDANFVCVLGIGDVSILIEYLHKMGIIVRPLTSFGLSDGVRLSIGSEVENLLLIKGLKGYYNEANTTL